MGLWNALDSPHVQRFVNAATVVGFAGSVGLWVWNSVVSFAGWVGLLLSVLAAVSAAFIVMGAGYYLLLFIRSRGWFGTPVRQIHHVDLGATAKATASLDVKVIRASEQNIATPEELARRGKLGAMQRALDRVKPGEIEVTLTPTPVLTEQQMLLEVRNRGKTSEFWTRYRIIEMRHALGADRADKSWHTGRWINTDSERTDIQHGDHQMMLVGHVQMDTLPGTKQQGGLLMLWEHRAGLNSQAPFEWLRWKIGDPWPESDLEVCVYAKDVNEPHREFWTVKATSLSTIAMSPTPDAR